MINFKPMHRWNPICKGFMLSHFGWVCCVGQHRGMIHTIVRKSLVKYCKWHPNDTQGRKGLNPTKCYSTPRWCLSFLRRLLGKRGWLSLYRWIFDIATIGTFRTLPQFQRNLFNELTSMTPQTNNTCRKLRVSAFQQSYGLGVADRVFMVKY
jgi:hypothetical protein